MDVAKNEVIPTLEDFKYREQFIEDAWTENTLATLKEKCGVVARPKITMDVGVAKLFHMLRRSSPAADVVGGFYRTCYSGTADQKAFVKNLKAVHIKLLTPIPKNSYGSHSVDGGYRYVFDRKTHELTVLVHENATNVWQEWGEWVAKQ